MTTTKRAGYNHHYVDYTDETKVSLHYVDYSDTGKYNTTMQQCFSSCYINTLTATVVLFSVCVVTFSNQSRRSRTI